MLNQINLIQRTHICCVYNPSLKKHINERNAKSTSYKRRKRFVFSQMYNLKRFLIGITNSNACFRMSNCCNNVNSANVCITGALGLCMVEIVKIEFSVDYSALF